jgi:DNA modification methylase
LAHAEILHGDMRIELADLAACGFSCDAIITDPPYHLTSTVKRFGKPGSAPAKSNGATGVYTRASKGFMGKEWDGGDIAFQPETWKLCFDLLKPGGHLVAFGGSRTNHRIACAIEDAGFEIRDSLMWIYGSGFPKSHDVAMGIDKSLGRVGDVIPSGAPQARMIPGADQNNTGSWIKDNGRTYQPGEYQPATPEAAAWEGWGTSLKPAYEPIILARKPLDGTVAANVLKHGCGGINIDGCRVECDARPLVVSNRRNGNNTYGDGLCGSKAIGETAIGRFPANVLHDGSDEVIEAFAAFGKRTSGKPGIKHGGNTGSAYGKESRPPGTPMTGFGDTGSAARFYYCAKANKDDRAGSKHPTIKPISLMRWLCRLVTPPGGLILDPFAGSGTTGSAALQEGLNAVLVERDPEYITDIRRRLGLS